MVDLRSLKFCVLVSKRALRISRLASMWATIRRRVSAMSLVVEIIVRGLMVSGRGFKCLVICGGSQLLMFWQAVVVCEVGVDKG